MAPTSELTNADLAAVGLPPRPHPCWTCPRAAQWLLVSHWRIEDSLGVEVKTPTKRYACHHHLHGALVTMTEWGPDVKVIRAMVLDKRAS